MHRRPRPVALTRTVVIASLAAMVASCGSGGGNPFELGIRRIALDLAFAEEALAEPVEPEVIIQIIPAPPEVVVPEDLSQFEILPDTPPADIVYDMSYEPPCPAGVEGAAPQKAVMFAPALPPTPGTYPRHNPGQLRVEGGLVPLVLPFPPETSWEISPSTSSVKPGVPPLVPDFTEHVWTVTKTITPTYTVTEQYRLTSDAIELVSRETKTDAGVTTFTPTPPVEYYKYGVEGDDWASSGVDTETNTAMLVQGNVERREVVDVCGEPIDTYRTTITEQVVNLDTGEVSGSDLQKPNVLNVATQFGGLFVREEVRNTVRTRDPESNVPITIVFDYVSTMDSVQPAAAQ